MNKIIKPNFLVLGVPKAGTTSLFEYIKEHPDVFLPSKKELHYFSYEILKNNVNGKGDKNVLRELISSKKEYFKIYQNVEKERVIAEVSPSYLYHLPLIKNKIIDELGKNIKVCILLRNPVHRTYSNFKHQVRMGYEKEDFRNAMIKEEERKKAHYGDIWQYRKHSLYADPVLEAFKVFGKKNVKIILFENFIDKPLETCSTIFDFLGIDHTFVPNSLQTTFNEGGGYNQGVLSKFLLRPNKFKTSAKKFIPDTILASLKEMKNQFLNENQKKFPSMIPKDEEFLKSYFKKDVEKLKIILGNSMKEWSQFKE